MRSTRSRVRGSGNNINFVHENTVAWPSCPDGMNAEMYSELVTDVATQAYQTYQEKYRDVVNRGGQVLQYNDNERHEFRYVAFIPSAIITSTLQNGGGSYALATNMSLQVGKDEGYMCAAYPERSAWSKANASAQELTDDATNFVKANLDVLSTPGMCLGTWISDEDPTKGQISWDISERIMDRNEAIQRGKERNQQAIFNLADGEDIATGGTGMFS